MKTYFYLNGKRISKAKLIDILGKSTVDRFLAMAKRDFYFDPFIQNDFATSYGIVTIEFK